MKTKHTLIRFVATIILFVGGTTLLFLSDGQHAKLYAQSSDYYSIWAADPNALLKVNATFEDLRSPGVPISTYTGDAMFGVWRWTVKGALNGSSFRETWNAPEFTLANPTTLKLNPINGTIQEGCNIPIDIDPTKILVGCIADNKSVGSFFNTFSYNITSNTVTNFHFKSRYNQGTGNNYATSCIDSPRNGGETECIIGTGAYGFSHLHEPGSNSSFRWLGAGMVMPLKWTVTGRLCPGVTNPDSCSQSMSSRISIKPQALDLTQWSSSILTLSVIVFLAGLVQFGVAHARSQVSNSSDLSFTKTSLTERDIAIAEAIKEGKTEYSFTSNFTPGIGRIVNPDKYLEDWKKAQEQKLPQLTDAKHVFNVDINEDN